MDDVEFDYVIVGGGTAGCVLAARLGEDPSLRIAVLEAGGRDWNPVFRIPLMTGVLLRNRYANWFYHTEPEPDLGGRRIFWPRGKVLGGSSSINGMVYVRGLPSDFDTWAQFGLPSWSWDRVQPYFRRSERYDGGGDATHGADGPLRTSRPPSSSPASDAFVAAGRQAGFPESTDFNGPSPEGVGRYDFNISGGQRWSTARAFLAPALRRGNVQVVTRAHALRIALEGRRAVAVEAAVRGKPQLFRARREVLLCGGVVNSPQLLLLSGIGDADALRPLGITPVHDLKPVGRNLQDHLLVRVEHVCTQPVTLHGLMRFDRAALAFISALAFRRGPMTRFPLEAGGYLKSDRALDLPDLQCHFLPGLSTAALRLPGLKPPKLRHDGHGFFANAYQMRPESRGELTLASADPMAPPRIQPRYLSAVKDRLVMRRAVELLREIFAQRAFDPFRGEELSPGPAVRTPTQIDEWVRNNADTVFHAAGTCRMGPGVDAVVDESLRVHGLEALRVVDASIMPTITSTNTHATAIMIAERAADLILGRAPPAPAAAG
ncbi:MAG: choline dehydrogenase [Alphaproteobacteria bacterium]|nr:choline dehydrogenase [Alphaproteobacteria bacterium]